MHSLILSGRSAQLITGTDNAVQSKIACRCPRDSDHTTSGMDKQPEYRQS